MNALTRYHTPAALVPFFIMLCATFLPFMTKTTDDVAISPLCLLSMMVRGLACHRTWVAITMLMFCASSSSHIISRPSVLFPMYNMRRTASIFCLSQHSSSSTSTTGWLTVLAAEMMISLCRISIAPVAFCCVIAVSMPLPVFLAFMILMWARVCWWKSTLLMTNIISWSILLGIAKHLSHLSIRGLSAMLDPVVWVGTGPGGAIRL